MKEIKAERVLPSYKLSVLLEMDLKSLKIKIWDIHLYFIATKYLWNNALVEYIDN